MMWISWCIISFWKTNYYTNNTLLDYQLGVAFPSIVTGKIGFGIGMKILLLLLVSGHGQHALIFN